MSVAPVLGLCVPLRGRRERTKSSSPDLSVRLCTLGQTTDSIFVQVKIASVI